jgi:hypothetical protein
VPGGEEGLFYRESEIMALLDGIRSTNELGSNLHVIISLSLNADFRNLSTGSTLQQLYLPAVGAPVQEAAVLCIHTNILLELTLADAIKANIAPPITRKFFHYSDSQKANLTHA